VFPKFDTMMACRGDSQRQPGYVNVLVLCEISSSHGGEYDV
jgi:hypothetical protein